MITLDNKWVLKKRQNDMHDKPRCLKENRRETHTEEREKEKKKRIMSATGTGRSEAWEVGNRKDIGSGEMCAVEECWMLDIV